MGFFIFVFPELDKGVYVKVALEIKPQEGGIMMEVSSSSWVDWLLLGPVIIYLVLIIVGVYIVVKVIKFMNAKIKLDKERNEKFDELIRAMNKDKDAD